ncbi:hypothetical protein H5410_029501 [Solanum commersonii]|uniref:NB-ARC domain-containing protein n=1 Tax=Solanum commersonii TaxID=4109 RepID=A0A9J5Z554_SOLCO|nr:hypothetical protein H5410_029501 [Solanum commersonii]
MLVHLKYLIIYTEEKALSPSFSNLCNLETLVMNHLEGSCMILSPWFWSLAKLRDVRIKCCAVFDPDIKVRKFDGGAGEWNMEDVTFKNLKYLKLKDLSVSEWQVDAEKSFPMLEKLDVISLWTSQIVLEIFPQLKKSTFNIKEYVEQMTGEDKLDVCFQVKIGRGLMTHPKTGCDGTCPNPTGHVSYVDSLRESLIHLQEYMVINAVTPTASTCNIHVMIEFLVIILIDVPKDIICHDKLSVLVARVRELTEEVFVLFCNLEENMNEASGANLNLLESIELLKEDLKNDFLKARADSSQLHFPMSDGPLFMTLLLTNLKDFVNSNASSVTLIKKEIKQVKEDLEIIRSFFGYVEQELHRDLWTRVLDVAYEAEHAIHSILARNHGLLQLIFILPDTVEKIKLVKKEVQEKIPKSSGIIVANAPNKLVERNSSSTVGKIIVGFEEETKWIIRKLTRGPAEIDVISIVGMPGIGKTTLAFRVYNDKSIVHHFDVCAWCTVDQERNEKKLLVKIFNQVIGLKERVSENDIDDDVADKLRKKLCGQRYLIVLDDMWDTATLDELTRPFPELHKGSRVILTSRKKEVALHGKCHSDPLYLRLLRLEESWELLEKRVFGEERCPDELKDVGEKIARKCGGLPLVLDLIGGVISRKEKKEALWLEVLNNLSSFIFKDEEELVKVIQLSYDHLSDHVKPCLIYLAIYPKDKDIRISKLKDLWNAQGFEIKSADEVVDELISSSLVIPFDNSICKIHDLVHDFCYIKSRKEKLLHFLGRSKSPSSSSSSSSDLMARGILIRFKKYIFRLNENFVVFNPEKKNPYVKHLLSLKVYKGRLPPKSHLKHLRLLKSLDLKGIKLTDSLKYLIIQTK